MSGEARRSSMIPRPRRVRRLDVRALLAGGAGLALAVVAASACASSAAPDEQRRDHEERDERDVYDAAQVTSSLGAATSETAYWVNVVDPPFKRLAGAAYDEARGQLVYFGGALLSSVYEDTCLFDARGWSCPSLPTQRVPAARYAPYILYEPARKRVLLYGGATAGGAFGDTWSWDGVAWTEESGASPPARLGATIAYDVKRGRAILFGGRGDAGVLADTWTWDGARWTELAGPRPPARYDATMVYDPKRERVVLHGGRSADANGTPRDDTWLWDGASWVEAGGPKPPPRSSAVMAYLAAREQVVLFGGQDGDDAPRADTWVWNGVAWSRPNLAVSPPPRSRPHLAPDPPRGELLLFGGSQDAGYMQDTWVWNGTAWREIASAELPEAREGGVMIYDPGRQRVLLAGGQGTSFVVYPWTWDGASWSRVESRSSPSARSRGHVVYDEERKTAVLYGGEGAILTYPTDTALWQPTGWRRSFLTPTPPGRGQGVMVYDPVRQNTVLFGGRNGSSTFSDTWTWSGEDWSEVASASPPARHWASAAFDRARGRVLLFGGISEGGAPLGDTWSWDGASWTQVATSGPSARYGAMLVDDPVRQRVVLFGGAIGTAQGQFRNDTWTWDGEAWTAMPVTSPPIGRVGTSAVFDAARGNVVMFGGSSFYAGYDHALDDTWTWSGTTWLQVGQDPKPPRRAYAQLVYDGDRSRAVLTAGWDAYNGAYREDAWSWDGARWTPGAPTARGARSFEGHAFYDAVHHEVVYFGGRTGSSTLAYSSVTQRLVAFGAGCTTSAECPGAACVDGACCKQDACAPCERCDAPSRPGVCTPVTGAADPDSCSGARACDARGTCRGALGRTCTNEGDCASGFCVDGVCCEEACDAQCAACNVPGAEGRCQPVRGKPRGVRIDCEGASSAGDDVCARPGCDGIEIARCNGTIGPCAPFACTLEGCAEACVSDADCAPAAYCDVGVGACKPRTAPVCDGDRRLVARGFTQDCAPYRCAGSDCKDRCESVADCAVPFECSRDGRCVPALAPPEGGACAVTTRGLRGAPGGAAGRAGLLAVVAASLALLTARRARRARAARETRHG